MLSRLATTASSRIASRHQPPQSRIAAAAASTTTGRTADPALYSGELKPGPDVDYPEPHGARSDDARKSSEDSGMDLDRKTDTDPLTKPKSPLGSSARVESAGVINPTGGSSNFQQKRKASTGGGVLDSVSCVGVDGTLETEKRDEDEFKCDDESNKEYFSHHKASPLSEIKIADTRKPVTRATDWISSSQYGGGAEVIGWRPEQLETAEETMLKAMEIWKQNAMRGDPETFPHSRVLRELRGEWF